MAGDQARGSRSGATGPRRAAASSPAEPTLPGSAGSARADPATSLLAASVQAHTRALDRLEEAVAASTARLEHAFQGLAMRVEMLESATEDAIRGLRELQAAVAGIPTGTGLDRATLDRWSAEQADAVTAVEKQLMVLGGQMDALRRRIPLKARRDGE